MNILKNNPNNIFWFSIEGAAGRYDSGKTTIYLMFVNDELYMRDEIKLIDGKVQDSTFRKIENNDIKNMIDYAVLTLMYYGGSIKVELRVLDGLANLVKAWDAGDLNKYSVPNQDMKNKIKPGLREETLIKNIIQEMKNYLYKSCIQSQAWRSIYDDGYYLLTDQRRINHV